MPSTFANTEPSTLMGSLPPDLLAADIASADNSMLEKQEHSPQNLKTAFDLFNDLSLQLADSYQHLEKRVADLSSELEEVSEQRYVELQEKEQLASRLSTLITVLPGGVIVLDKTGMIIESNPVAEVFLEPDLIGKYWREVIQRCFAPKDDDGHEVSNRDGKRISIVTGSLGEDGQIILLTDQTETRQLQADLSRNERLSALGKMVSTLAHQVRTPLSSAMLYAGHLSTKVLSETQRQNFTNKLLGRLNYMERQVRDMLLFVKGDVPLTDKVSLTKLKETLAEAIEMPIKSYEANCQWIQKNIDTEDDIYLRCNLDALVGALLNLVNNSLQATPSVELNIQFQIENHKLVIDILDNGPGLDLSTKDKTQELFFTTKEQGTGIGLSVVNVVAESHGGSFELENRKEGGACARLCLPLVL
ncbi:MAG: sensor histidine kinase [Cellvibrionaceae bacterium]